MARNAIKSGFLTIKGKNGKQRTAPINDLISVTLRKQLEVTERGEKLLVPNDVPTHVYIKQLQQFIRYYRNKLPERQNKERLTFHGLRHTYSVNKFNEFINSGYTEWQAKKAVSKLLGHERGDVTEIYLSSLKKNGGEQE